MCFVEIKPGGVRSVIVFLNSRLGVPVLVLLQFMPVGRGVFSFEFTPWGSAFFFLKSRLWTGDLSFEVTLRGSGVCMIEIPPRLD